MEGFLEELLVTTRVANRATARVTVEFKGWGSGFAVASGFRRWAEGVRFRVIGFKA